MVLEFTFRPNPYIANRKLRITTTENEEDNIDIDRIRSTLIEWKPGMNYLVDVSYSKRKGKTKIREQRNESFMWIFKNYNANDYNSYDSVDSQDEKVATSDECLFYTSCDIIDLLVNKMYTYIIPLYYDLYVPELDISSEFGTVDEDDEDGWSDEDSESDGSDDGLCHD